MPQPPVKQFQLLDHQKIVEEAYQAAQAALMQPNLALITTCTDLAHDEPDSYIAARMAVAWALIDLAKIHLHDVLPPHEIARFVSDRGNSTFVDELIRSGNETQQPNGGGHDA